MNCNGHLKSLLRTSVRSKSNQLHVKQLFKDSPQRTTALNLIAIANQVFVSNETCIYRNLAIEHWLFRQRALSLDERSLLMWIDGPSVVVGRHQNPWHEANVRECRSRSISLARRNSGGGTVFHDSGNLNICFLSHRKQYDRKQNLTFLVDTLARHFGLATEITCREDLVLASGKQKVSGTASKLAYDSSYHHCTLLINSDLASLGSCLKKQNNNIVSNATQSIRSPVANLNVLQPTLTVEQVINAISHEFCARQKIDSVCQIDFDDRLMNGIEDIRSELSSWEWIFGKTPKFSLKHQKMADQWYECTINVQHGRIVSVTIVQIRDLSPVDQIPDLTGLPLMESPIESALESWFQRDPSIRALFIKQLIQETTASAFF